LALSRLPPRAAEKVTAPPESWPPNQIPVLDSATFNDTEETADRDTVVANTEGTAPAAAAGINTPSTAEVKDRGVGGGEEKNGRADRKRDSINDAGVQDEAGSEGQETVSGHAVNLGMRRGSEAEEKKSSKPGPKSPGDKPDILHKMQAEADANEATGDTESDAATVRGNAEPNAAEGNGNAERPLEEGDGAGLGGEKDSQNFEHRQGLPAIGPVRLAEDQETGPAVKAGEVLEAEIDGADVEGSVKGVDQQHPAPGPALPVEDAEVPRQMPDVKSEGTAGGGLVADSALREGTTLPKDPVSVSEIEPSDSPSSPGFRSRSSPPENPLSWSDEEQMKLARDSYGSQGFAALGIAPLHSLPSPGSADDGIGVAPVHESVIHSSVHERARAESPEVVAAERHAEDAVEGVNLGAPEKAELPKEEEVQSRELSKAGTRGVDEGGGKLVTKTASEPLSEQVTRAASGPSTEQVTRPASESLLQHRSGGVDTKEARTNLEDCYTRAFDTPQGVETAKLEGGMVKQASIGQVDGHSTPEVPPSMGDAQEVTVGSPTLPTEDVAEEQAGGGVLGDLAVFAPPSGAAETSAPTEIDRLWQATKERLFASGDRIRREAGGTPQMEEEQEVASNISEAGSSNQSGKFGGGYDSGLEPSLAAAEREPEPGGQAGGAFAAARLAGTLQAVFCSCKQILLRVRSILFRDSGLDQDTSKKDCFRISLESRQVKRASTDASLEIEPVLAVVDSRTLLAFLLCRWDGFPKVASLDKRSVDYRRNIDLPSDAELLNSTLMCKGSRNLQLESGREALRRFGL
jgi:hypothetical protein